MNKSYRDSPCDRGFSLSAGGLSMTKRVYLAPGPSMGWVRISAQQTIKTATLSPRDCSISHNGFLNLADCDSRIPIKCTDPVLILSQQTEATQGPVPHPA